MTQKERLVELLLPQLFMFSAVDCGKLADYLLSNGVIVPPCKVGDTVWMLMDDSHAILPVKIWIIEIHKDTTWFEGNREDGMREFFNASDFGKTVFLSREAAEQALKERDEK